MSIDEKTTLVDLAPADVHPHPDNPRTDATADTELVASVASMGILEPLVVRWVAPLPDDEGNLPDGYFQLIAGHRRLDAARKVGLLTVPCVVKEFSDEMALEAMLVENLARRDLDPMEEAAGLSKLVDLGLKPKAIAAKLGRSTENVKGRLALLTLPDKLQAKVRDGSLNLAHADLIAKLPAEVAAKLKPGELNDWTLKRKVEDHKATLNLAKVEKRLEKAGTLYMVADGYKLPDNVKYLGDGYAAIAVDPDLHAFEPCHITVLRTYQAEVEERPACSDPERHVGKGKGKSKLKVPDPDAIAEARRAEREAEEIARYELLSDEDKAAHDARRAEYEAREAERHRHVQAARDRRAAREAGIAMVLPRKLDADAALDLAWEGLVPSDDDWDDDESTFARIAEVMGLAGTTRADVEEWRTKNRTNRITALAAWVALDTSPYTLEDEDRIDVDTFLQAHGIAPPPSVTTRDTAVAAFTEWATPQGFDADAIAETIRRSSTDELVAAVAEVGMAESETDDAPYSDDEITEDDANEAA